MTNDPKVEKRAFFILLLLLMVGGIYVLLPFVKTVILSMLLAVVFYPLHKNFLKWTHNRPNLAATFSLLSVILFLFIPTAVLLTLITSQVAVLLEHFPTNISQQGLQTMLHHWYAYLEPYVYKLEHFFGVQFDLFSVLMQGIRNFAEIIAQYSPGVVSGTASFFFHFFILIIVLFYLFRDGAKFFKTLIIISPVKDKYELKLAEEIQETVYGIFYGSFLTGLVQASLSTLGFYMAGIEGFLVWGTITFFVSFIPVVGTAAVFIPLVLVLIFQGHVWHGVFLAVYGIVITGSADNLLKPLLIRSNMHPVVLFLSIFGGMAVFGASGLLLGPIVLALLTATIKIYASDFRESSA